jgi:hypothetical protein
MEERIEQLKAQEAQLQMQLDEIRFLIQGYENTLITITGTLFVFEFVSLSETLARDSR